MKNFIVVFGKALGISLDSEIKNKICCLKKIDVIFCDATQGQIDKISKSIFLNPTYFV